MKRRAPSGRERAPSFLPPNWRPKKQDATQAEYLPRPLPTAEERLFKLAERRADGAKAFIEYEANQRAVIQNMQRLRALRLSRQK
jgi:hypothetical protein